jgi:hypothetical protein
MRIRFALAMGEITSGVLRGEVDFVHAAERLEKAAKWARETALLMVEHGEAKPETEANDPAGPSNAEIHEVFEHWRTVTKRPNATLTNERRQHIRGRLRRFSVAALKHALTWAAKEPWYQGENDRGQRYDYPENLFRNDSKVEKLLERSGWKAPVDASQSDAEATIAREHEIAELRRQARDALDAGEIEKYNALNAEVKRATGRE